MKMLIRTNEGLREIEENVEEAFYRADGRLEVVQKLQGGWLRAGTVYKQGAVIEKVMLEETEG